MSEARTQLSSLLKRVEAGDEVVLCRAGEPVARLVPYKKLHLPRTPGAWKGKVWIADDFDELPEDIAAAFRGELP